MLLPYLRDGDTTAMLLPYLRKADTVGMRAKEVLSFAKNAARDSAILTLFDGTRFPVMDSIGGGGLTIDSVAVRRIGNNYIGWNSGNGGTGTNGGTRGGIDSSNIFIGRISGNAVTSGYRNIALGDRTLESNSTGFRNIAIGISALRLYTGSDNTAIGSLSLTSATGSGNTGVGSVAGTAISSGANNTAIGNAALQELTTASGNTAIGNGAGRTVTSGANNTSVGNLAGANGAAAKNSTVSVGFEAGRYTAESLSTWLGVDAGQGASGNLHTGGSYNLGLGYRTMFDISGVRTGSSNTAIGDRINLPSRTSSNQFVYGSNGINWLTRFTDGGWLINYTASAVTAQTASAALEVNGTTGAVLFPRLTTEQRNALTPTNGMVIYNTSTDKLQVRAAAAWVDLH
jgi:hypothetical protein